MGFTLQNTSASVNIRERLDFSCAVFDGVGELVANAPHIPVHLGSMGESVKALISDRDGCINFGDVFATNNPYNGGTHLPDITVITPVFIESSNKPTFYVASRGHHADIGGITHMDQCLLIVPVFKKKEFYLIISSLWKMDNFVRRKF